MPQQVSLQQATRNALADWLRSQLVGEEISVAPRWVNGARDLTPKRITIIDAGPRQLDWLQIEVLQTTNVDTENGVGVKKVDAIWNFGFMTQALQLDVWAQTDVELDDIVAKLDGALNKGAAGLGISNVNPFAAGLQLNLCDGWEPGVVDLEFDDSTILQSPENVGEGEWRVTYRGTASAQMTQAARSARIARILLETRVYERDPVDESAPADETIILTTDT